MSDTPQDVKEVQQTLENVSISADAPVSAPEQTKKTPVDELRELQTTYLSLEEEYENEVKALKYKYSIKYNPLYSKRKEVLQGHAPTAESGTPAVAEFWLTAFKNNDDVNALIKPCDEPILAFLTDVRCEWFNETEQTDFKVCFDFAPNPYFKNKTLEKSFIWNSKRDLAKTEGTVIEWNEGKDVTTQVVTKKQKNKKTKQVRTITETVANESIFRFFEGRDIPTGEDLEKMDDEDVEALETVIKMEYEAGEAIRDTVIPRALGWYLGEEQNYGESDEDYDDEGSSDEDSDDDEDDDEESDGAAPNKKTTDDQCKTQ